VNSGEGVYLCTLGAGDTLHGTGFGFAADNDLLDVALRLHELGENGTGTSTTPVLEKNNVFSLERLIHIQILCACPVTSDVYGEVVREEVVQIVARGCGELVVIVLVGTKIVFPRCEIVIVHVKRETVIEDTLPEDGLHTLKAFGLEIRDGPFIRNLVFINVIVQGLSNNIKGFIGAETGCSKRILFGEKLEMLVT
jgi:hypothetical protein